MESTAGVDPFALVGETLAGRFRVERLVAEGGFGVVYLAQQLVLDRPVALKVLKPGSHLLPQQRQAFLRSFQAEARTIARLKHPHIVEVYDFGVTEGGAGQLLHWMALEWLQGQTLQTLLEQERSAGRPPRDCRAALELVRPLLQAIAFAHRQGVVHRDLKPANVCLSPAVEAPVLKVLDFGIAQILAGGQEGPAASSKATTRNFAAFSPAYAAPEQVSYGRTGPWTDVHALGLILTEVLTGQHPYQDGEPERGLQPAAEGEPEENREQLEAVVSEQRPTPASKGVMVAGWEAVLARALARRPAERYPDAGALLEALEAGLPGPATDTLVRGPAAVRGRRRVALALGALVVALALTGTALLWRGHPAGAGRTARPSVAVLGMANLSGRADDAWLTTAFPELLTTELAQGGAVRTVPDENVARVRRDLNLAPSQSLASDTLARVRENLAADYLVLGSYLVLEAGGSDQVLLTLRLQDVTSGEVVQVASEKGPKSDLFSLVSRAGGALRRRMGVRQGPSTAIDVVRATLPRDSRAARLYVEGLQRTHSLDLVGATALIEQSLAIEPDFPLGYGALANIWAWRGHDARARDAARQAFERSAGLDPDARLLIEGRLRETNHEWPRAVEIYRTLWDRFPDDLEYGLALARVQERAHQAREALVTTASLHRLPAPQGDDPRIDIIEADAHSTLSEYPAKDAAAARAIQKGRARGARELVAAALIRAGWALERQARFDEALAAFTEARSLSQAGSDRAGVGLAMHSMAMIHTEQGRSALAVTVEDQALAMLRAVGDELNVPRSINVRAIGLTYQGYLSQALAGYREAGRLQGLIGAMEDQGYALLNEATILERLGDLPGAEAVLARGKALFERFGFPYGEAWCALEAGVLGRLRGQLPAARASVEAAVATFTRLGNRAEAAFAEEELAENLFSAGRRAEARSAAERSLTMRQQMGVPARIGRSQLLLARIALDAGDARQAEALAGQALRAFEAAHHLDDATAAALVRGAALIKQGRPGEGQVALRAAGGHGLQSENFVVRLRTGAALTRDPARLRALEQEAARAGTVELTLELRLAGTRSRTDAAALARSAWAKGFERLAEAALR